VEIFLLEAKMAKSAQKLLKELQSSCCIPKNNTKVKEFKDICGKYILENAEVFSYRFLPERYRELYESIVSAIIICSEDSTNIIHPFSLMKTIVLKSGREEKVKTLLISIFGKKDIDEIYNLLIQKKENLVFEISCKYKDILRMSLSKHFDSCRNLISGGWSHLAVKAAKDPISGIVYIRDKRGDFIWRNCFSLVKNDQLNKVCLFFNATHFGNAKSQRYFIEMFVKNNISNFSIIVNDVLYHNENISNKINHFDIIPLDGQKTLSNDTENTVYNKSYKRILSK